jgi:PAS domain S-box-containing protein
MASGTIDTGELIRRLGRRQWAVLLAVAALALGALFLDWRLIANNEQAAENVNLAGRQRMLSQRMAMYLVLQGQESDGARRRQYRELSGTAAAEFEQSHERLLGKARMLGADSTIYSLYFGPQRSLDAESRRYLALVREYIAASAIAKPGETENISAILDAAGNGLIAGLDQVTRLYQRDAEEKVRLMLRLLLVSTLLIVALLAVAMFHVFRPVIRRLADDVAARDRAERELMRRERRERQRNRILEAIATGVPLSESLGLMAAMAETELPGAICSVQRLDRTSGKLFSAWGSSLSKAFTDAVDGLQIGVGVGACGTAAATASRIVVADIASYPDCPEWRSLAAAEGVRACWSQPVISSAGTVLGTLAIYHREPCSPGEDQIQVVDLLASLATISLERDEAEQMLRQQQEETRKLLAEHETTLNNALVGIVYLRQRRVVSCNRRLEEIFGYAPGELIGESSERFYASRESFETVGEEAYRTVGENRNFSTELLLKRKDGSLFRGALTGRAIDPAHPHEGSIWVYADISERYRAEREAHKLLQAVEQSPVSIVITDREGIIEYVNPRFTKVTGYSSREIVGRNPRILQSGETPVETYRRLWQTLLAGKEWRGILRNRRKNGELFWEEASISPIVGDSGETTHYIAVKEDITGRKRIEDELEQHRAHLEDLVERRTADLSAALEAAKAAEQAKDAFLAHVSHELRTPLNAVIGLSELARRLSTDPRQQDYLDKAGGAGKTLTRIIDDLLDLSKISASRMELESTTFSLRALIQRSQSVMAHRATEKGLELIERIDAAVPDVLLGDPMRIEQILLNLLSNAIKFTPAGRIELRIGLDARDQSRVCLSIEVEDSGIGLAEETVERLFRPFAQADASMNRKFGGTGLGLVLCKRLAQMMGGQIGVTSREGAGATFRVTLWLGLGDAADLPEVAQVGRRNALPDSYRDARVLVVDDQPLNREIVEALLAQVGITPRIATNGQEALDILRTSGPGAFDLVLMDIQMPIVDGLAATREIRAWPGFSDLPVIAMTAHTMHHEKEINSAAGMNDHIGKPFEASHFFHLLARWIPQVKHRLSGAQEPAGRSIGVGLAALSSIDTRAGLERFVGNEERYRHWLHEFVGAAPDYAGQIRRHLAAGNTEAARQSAHAIKGRVGLLGMTRLHPIAAALEAALMQGAPTEDLLDRMHGMIEGLCTEIQDGLGARQQIEAVASSQRNRRPPGPMTESVARLLVMLQSADGDSAEAIERCLAERGDVDWAPCLKQALAHVRTFDFDAACGALAASPSDREC